MNIPNAPYQYSIDKAAQLYRGISSQEEMTAMVKENIEAFFRNKGLDFNYRKGNGDYLTIDCYESSAQDIQVMVDKSGNITGFGFVMHQPYSEELLLEAYYGKALFGAPIFAMMVVTDFIDRATLTIMSRNDYLKMDNPESRIFQQRMNYLDDLINRYGGWDED